MTINEKALAAALTAFIDGVRQQDPNWYDEFDEEITLVAPDGDYFAPELPLQSAITAYLSALGSEPVAWRWPEPNTGGFYVVVGSKPCEDLDRWQPLYAAPPAPAIPEGWKLVPKDPDKAMIEAGRTQTDFCHETWAAMLAAAPEAPHE